MKITFSSIKLLIKKPEIDILLKVKKSIFTYLFRCIPADIFSGYFSFLPIYYRNFRNYYQFYWCS